MTRLLRLLRRLFTAFQTTARSLAVDAYERMTGNITRSEHRGNVITTLLPPSD